MLCNIIIFSKPVWYNFLIFGIDDYKIEKNKYSILSLIKRTYLISLKDKSRSVKLINATIPEGISVILVWVIWTVWRWVILKRSWGILVYNRSKKERNFELWNINTYHIRQRFFMTWKSCFLLVVSAFINSFKK